MFWQAVLAFVTLPGMVGFVIPGLLLRPDPTTTTFHWIGIVPIAIGTFLLLWCVRDFYVAGRGTLAPWTPPKRLVVVGLYRFSRNPMYVAVATILIGWVIAFQTRTLLIYVVLVLIAFHLRVVYAEEPWLAQMHGQQWQDYRARVPRWLFK